MEVSNATLVAYIDTFKQHNLDPKILIGGTDLTYEEIVNPKGKITWDNFQVITNNTFQIVGEEKALQSLKSTGVDNKELSPLAKIVAATVSAETIYWFFCNFVGKLFYKNLKFHYQKIRKGHIQITVKLNNGERCFDNFIKAYASAFEGFTQIIGLKPAHSVIDFNKVNPVINLYFKNSIKVWNPISFIGRLVNSITNTTKLLSEIEDRRHEQILLNQELELLNKNLDESNKLNETLIRAIMHDLNNPMAIIQFKAEKLKDNIESFTTKDSDILNRAVSNMNGVISDLKKFHLAKTILCEDNFDVYDATIEARVHFEEVLREKNIQLEITKDESRYFLIKGNKTTFTNSIVSNLISNAIKFSFEGSLISINISKQNELIHFSIKDSGTGMNPTSINNFFERELSESQEGTNGEVGLGVGLTQVTFFTKQMQGQLDVNSIQYTDDKVNHGTEFKITFPTDNHSVTLH
ncbi:putative two-component system, sensor kinase [Halobacteriovorax marinus SJ]|uniref:histidine kinase n=1 Tax=Halobacteriovorax marinus (strain ATCC BAA-682 / DSM 15412 / SJ) TaxID=862908 RepID=E1X0U5_HALMS|nr:HAMP domain-containing sensor histidine kinase [Halobacteriovorax marinus]CBW26433.1 putative two-component system, sensor kinase [Halobacteriovorax marinus SJ]